MKITLNDESIKVLKEMYPNGTNRDNHDFVNHCVKWWAAGSLAKAQQREKAKNFASQGNYSNEWYAVRDNIELVTKIETVKNILIGNSDVSIPIFIEYAPHYFETIRCGIVKNSELVKFMNFKGSINLKNGGFLDNRGENFAPVEDGKYDIYTYNTFVVLLKIENN